MRGRCRHGLVVALLALAHSVRAYSGLDTPRGAFFEDVLAANGADQAKCKPTGMIKDACCHFEEVERLNERLSHALNDVVKEPFFRYHKVDLYRDCPFWSDDGGLCGNRACAVDWMDESDIPELWRSERLGGLQRPDPGAVPVMLEGGCEVQDTDFCVLEDQQTSESIFVDLMENPERFTGYTGSSAHKVWQAIYEENCFDVVPYLPPSRGKEEGGSGFVTSLGSADLRTLMGSLAGPRDAGEETCLEKRVFYRLMSGLHASISIHICDEYLDQKTGEWSPNLQCFISRIAQHPERLQNVYFDYVLLLRAFEKAAKYFEGYDISTGDEVVDSHTRRMIQNLAREAQTCPSTFDESTMFIGAGADVLKEEFKSHFRNISRIMDCVGCDRCRLWGKLQVTGLGTALKLLFSFENNPLASTGMTLQRSEIVAFVNTLHRFSESLAAIDRFRRLWAERERQTISHSKVDSALQKSVVSRALTKPTDERKRPAVVFNRRPLFNQLPPGAMRRPHRSPFEAAMLAMPPQVKAPSVFSTNSTGAAGGVADFVDALFIAFRAFWHGYLSLASDILRHVWTVSDAAERKSEL